MNGGCSAAQLTTDHGLLLQCSQISCPKQLPHHAWNEAYLERLQLLSTVRLSYLPL